MSIEKLFNENIPNFPFEEKIEYSQKKRCAFINLNSRMLFYNILLIFLPLFYDEQFYMEINFINGLNIIYNSLCSLVLIMFILSLKNSKLIYTQYEFLHYFISLKISLDQIVAIYTSILVIDNTGKFNTCKISYERGGSLNFIFISLKFLFYIFNSNIRVHDFYSKKIKKNILTNLIIIFLLNFIINMSVLLIKFQVPIFNFLIIELENIVSIIFFYCNFHFYDNFMEINKKFSNLTNYLKNSLNFFKKVLENNQSGIIITLTKKINKNIKSVGKFDIKHEEIEFNGLPIVDKKNREKKIIYDGENSLFVYETPNYLNQFSFTNDKENFVNNFSYGNFLNILENKNAQKMKNIIYEDKNLIRNNKLRICRKKTLVKNKPDFYQINSLNNKIKFYSRSKSLTEKKDSILKKNFEIFKEREIIRKLRKSLKSSTLLNKYKIEHSSIPNNYKYSKKNKLGKDLSIQNYVPKDEGVNYSYIEQEQFQNKISNSK